MGVFTIKPYRLADVTCGLGEGTQNYIIVATSVDMGDGERYDAVKTGSMVPISFDAVIFGSTQADAFANYDTFSRALRDAPGGYIAYRPIGLDSAQYTYYHYRGGDGPKIEKTGLLSDPAMSRWVQGATDRSSYYGIKCSVKLDTKPWPTSDPETLVTVVAQTTIAGTDYSTDDCSVIVPSSSIEGDVLFPVIEVVGSAGAGNDVTKLLVHRRRMRTSANTNLDFIEGEDMAGSGWSDYADASASGGYCSRASAASTEPLSLALPAFDSTYLGMLGPVVCARVIGETTYKARFFLTVNGREIESTDYQEIDTTSWDLYYKFGDVHMPPIPIPERVKDDTTPTIAQFLSTNVAINLEADRLSGTDYILVDFIVLANTDDYLALFTNDDSPILGAGTNTLQIDSLSQCAFLLDASGYLSDKFDKRGPPLSDLVLEKGYDHRIRFLGWDTSYDSSWDLKVTIKGIWGSILPFEEA